MEKVKLIEIFKQAFSEMDERFTSNEILSRMRELGVDVKKSNPNYSQLISKIMKILEKRAERVYGVGAKRSTTFVKKKKKQTTFDDQMKAIELLKSLGYKIMKPITQFEEI